MDCWFFFARNINMRYVAIYVILIRIIEISFILLEFMFNESFVFFLIDIISCTQWETHYGVCYYTHFSQSKSLHSPDDGWTMH